MLNNIPNFHLTRGKRFEYKDIMEPFFECSGACYLVSMDEKIRKAIDSNLSYQQKIGKLKKIYNKSEFLLTLSKPTNPHFALICRKALADKQAAIVELEEKTIIGDIRRLFTSDLDKKVKDLKVDVIHLKKEMILIENYAEIVKNVYVNLKTIENLLLNYTEKLFSDNELKLMDQWFEKNCTKEKIVRIIQSKKTAELIFLSIGKLHFDRFSRLSMMLQMVNFPEKEFLEKLKKIHKEEIEFAKVYIKQNPQFTIPKEETDLQTLFDAYQEAKQNNNFIFLFGLTKNYTEEQVNAAFRKKFASKLHPDKNLTCPLVAEIIFKLFENVRTDLIQALNK